MSKKIHRNKERKKTKNEEDKPINLIAFKLTFGIKSSTRLLNNKIATIRGNKCEILKELTVGRCSCGITYDLDKGLIYMRNKRIEMGLPPEGFQNMDNIFSEKNLTEMWIIILGILGLYLLLKMMKK